MTEQNVSIPQLTRIAKAIRSSIIEMLTVAKSGHSAGPLGMADVFTALYFAILKHDPKNPLWSERDRLILSCGHICPVLYASLAHAGYFPLEKLRTLRKIDSDLQGHPKVQPELGIETTSGPLGLGLSQAIGMATAFKHDGKKNRVYCVLSDGEHQEGQTWEAYYYAGARRLSNVTVLIDRNNIQIDGYTEDVLPLQPLQEKLQAFRWHVLTIDGHNIEAIIDACNQAAATQEQPTAIICNTIPGKGVSFMEGLPEWHGKPPTEPEAEQALAEIRESKPIRW